MKRIHFINGLAAALLLALTFTACKKVDYDDGFTTIGEVYFDASSVASFGDLEIRYNGHAVERRQDGGVSAPEGEHTFEFYNKKTGEKLAEKTVNVKVGSPEKYLLFQLEETQPISIINENEREPAAEEGQMKMRFANLTTKSLPYPTIDVLVYGKTNSGNDVLLGVLEGVTGQFEENYHVLPRNNDVEDVVAYYFGFRDHNKKDITFGDGSLFTNKDTMYEIYPSQLGVKDWVFSIYFIEEVWDYDEGWLPYTIKVEGEDKLFVVGNTVFMSH